MGKRLLFSALAVILILSPITVYGVTDKNIERIESFSARISILPEGGVEVTETIVLVSHDDIRWGLQRVLPRWQTADGIDYASDIQILEILRDGYSEEYRLTDKDQGLVLEVGLDDPLTPGRYVYTIKYRSSRQVQFLPDGESLIWNVTGFWPVPIERVSVSMEFARAPRPGFDTWTAWVGTNRLGEDWVGDQDEEGWLQFKSARPLDPGESMTVAATWPTGYSFTPPSQGRVLAMSSVFTLDHHRNLLVEEDIVLYNDGVFHQGFFRNFTNLYRDGDGKRRIADLDIHLVTLDGKQVTWQLEPQPTGIRLVVGDEDMPLPLGKSTLRINYSLDRQVAVGGDYEELSLRSPGLSSKYLVDQATVTIILPEDIPRGEILLAGYTRSTGGAGGEVLHYIGNDGQLVFAATRHLEPGENLVSAMAWPVGYLEPLTWQQNLNWMARDNASAVVVMVVIVLLLLWYIPVWNKVGRRPFKVEPLQSPPVHYSPAALRFLSRGVYDNRTFTAGVLSLAVKGCLMVVEEVGKYALVSSGVSPANLPPDETVLINSLFADRSAVFPSMHRELINSARRAHRQKLISMIRGNLYRSNRIWFYPAAIISVAAAAASGLLLPVSVWVIVSLAGFVFWCSFVALVAVRTWDLAAGLADDRGLGAVTLALTLEIIVVGAISFVWGRWLAGAIDWTTVAAVVAVVVVNAVFSRLLPSPTPKGREILEQSRGFAMWLASPEEGRPGGPSRFEKYLPYAVALDAASKWGRRFGKPKRQGSFSPRWYQGSRWHTINAETLAASLSMLPRSKQDGIK